MLGVLEDYRRGLVPLIAPLTLVRHYVRTLKVEYLARPDLSRPAPERADAAKPRLTPSAITRSPRRRTRRMRPGRSSGRTLHATVRLGGRPLAGGSQDRGQLVAFQRLVLEQRDHQAIQLRPRRCEQLADASSSARRQDPPRLLLDRGGGRRAGARSRCRCAGPGTDARPRGRSRPGRAARSCRSGPPCATPAASPP